MTSSNGSFSVLLTICAGNSPVTGEFPTQRPVTRSFAVFIDLRLNKWLSKQWRGWWFETPPCPFWCHCNAHPSPIGHEVLRPWCDMERRDISVVIYMCFIGFRSRKIYNNFICKIFWRNQTIKLSWHGNAFCITGPLRGQLYGAFIFPLWLARTNYWTNSRVEASDCKHHGARVTSL